MRESDMRSLARPGLLRIFAPLDPRERLSREHVLESWRSRLSLQLLVQALMRSTQSR